MPDHRHLIDVHILITDTTGRLLLTQRAGNDEFAGRWHAPSGKVESRESLTRAAVREAREEVGVIIEPADLVPIHIAHVADSGPEPRLGVFFHAPVWSGEPRNCEPAKCLAVKWFSAAEMTQIEIIEYPAVGIEALRARTSASFSEHGWHPTSDPAPAEPTDAIAANLIAASTNPHLDPETLSTQGYPSLPEAFVAEGPESGPTA